MFFLYKILSHFIPIYLGLTRIFSKNINSFLKKRSINIPVLQKSHKNRILIHCASLGEYEQGKLIASKCSEIGFEVLLSFFSPSGFEHKIDNPDPFIDQYLYLPIDTPSRQSKFLDQVQPDLVIIVKNEFWFNFMDQLSNRKIPFVFISMYLTGKKKYFKWPFFQLFKNINTAEHLFVQDQKTKELLETFVPKNKISITGDNRIESIIHSNSSSNQMYDFSDKSTVIYGSVYSDDINMIKEVIKEFPNCRHVIVPHHLDKDTLLAFKELLVFYRNTIDISLISEMGILKSLYKTANMAYIGGGFQNGVHNTLEAIIHGIPVVIGPKHQGFHEISQLRDSGYINPINSRNELTEQFKGLETKQLNKKKLDQFLESNKNKSAIIVDRIKHLL